MDTNKIKKTASSNSIPSKNFNVGKHLIIASEQEFKIDIDGYYHCVKILRKKCIIVSLGEFSNLFACGS